MRSGVGTAWPFTLAARFDFEELFFFFLEVVEVEEVCAAPGRLAPDTKGAALKRSAAPKIDNRVFLLIVCSSSVFLACGKLLSFRGTLRAEESLFSVRRNQREIPRFARNDKIKYSSKSSLG